MKQTHIEFGLGVLETGFRLHTYRRWLKKRPSSSKNLVENFGMESN